jgi:hypothetical protein
MNKMSKIKSATFYVEGPDWEQEVHVDPEVFDDERSQLFEAASQAIESQMKIAKNLNLGPILLVRKTKTGKKEAMVNAYICLNNVGQYELAEHLRENFKRESGNDLAVDTEGYSY